MEKTWNQIVASLPGAHILQTSEWAQVKACYSWQPTFHLWIIGKNGNLSHILKGKEAIMLDERTVAAALILQRQLTIGGFAARLRVLYVPKGPLLDWGDTTLRRRVLDDLQAYARKQGAFFIKVDPDVPLGKGIPIETGVPVGTGVIGQAGVQEDPFGADVAKDIRSRGWLFSGEQIQFRNTVLVDLAPSEEQLLANMKQKTRYNIRLALRKGVTVREGGLKDLNLLYRMYAETSLRDGFVIRDERYYQAVWGSFMRTNVGPLVRFDVPTAEPLIAEVEGEPVAALIPFHFASKAWYLYGMSRDIHRDWMPNYLLQWEAIRRAKSAGCQVYDLWGAPEQFNESDPLWGVYRFKEGLGGYVLRSLGAWDYPSRPLLYRLYTEILPRLLDRMRRKGRIQTRQSIGL